MPGPRLTLAVMAASTDPVSNALEAVLTRFAEMVRRVGQRHGLQEAELDEVLQEVRLRLWRARPDGESLAAAPASYVYRTAMSAALDLLRRRRAREHPRGQTRVDVSALDGLPAPGPADDAVEAAELEARVSHALAMLPENRRAAVRMYLAGETREEIARLLGWSEPKTRNLLYRGLAELRAQLARQGIGAGESR